MTKKKLSVSDQDQNESNKEGTGLLGLISMVFGLLSFVDSIVHLVKEAKDDQKSSKSRLSIALMVIRIVVCVQYLTVSLLSKKYHMKYLLVFLSTFTYALVLVIIMLLSCLAIKFQYSSISLICHIIASFLGLALTFNLLNIKYERKTSKLSKVLKVFSDNILAISTLYSVIMAVLIGIILRNNDPGWNDRSLSYIGFIGEIFLRMLKCLVLPLIFTSLVFAMGDIDTKLFGKIGSRTVAYYMTTTILAIILGIILVISIQPGTRGGGNEDISAEVKQVDKLTTEDTILDLIRNLFPDNIVESCFKSFTTKLINETDSDDIYDFKISSGKNDGINILGIVMFAIVFGVIIGQMKEEGKVLANFFRAFNNAMMIMTEVVIKFTPLAVTFLVLSQILKVKELSDLLGSVGYYTITVLLGLFIQGLIILPLTYLILTRKNPYIVLKKLSAPMMTAFGTASSTATMPVTFKCLEEDLRFDKRIVRFCIPVGATINMDGTALYEAVAAIFIAQYRGIELDIVKVIIIAITATAASIGAAGIPQAGLVTMVIVLNAVGLPVEDSALIIVIDWLIDRFRTAINVLGDSFGAGIVYHLSKKDLEEMDKRGQLDLPNNGNSTQNILN